LTSLRVPRQLRNPLAHLYPTRAKALLVVEDAGLDPAQIEFNDEAGLNWRAILHEALLCNRVEAILRVTARDYGRSIYYLRAKLFYIASHATIHTNDLQALYRQCIKARSAVVSPVETLDDILEELWDVPPQGSAVIEFVERLAYRTKLRPVAEQLWGWVDSVYPMIDHTRTPNAIASLRAEIAAETTTPVTAPSYLLVEITPDSDDNRRTGPKLYQVEITFWRHDGKERKWRAGDEPAVPLTQIPDVLNQVLAKYERLWGGNALYLEFFLPADLLSLDIDQWEYKLASTPGVKLGMEHPLVVRSLKRVRQLRFRKRWEERWRHFQQYAHTQTSEHIFWICAYNEYEELALRNMLIEAETTTCLGIAFAPAHQPEDVADPILGPLLDAGIPIAMWPRLYSATDEPATQLQAKLKQLCANKPLAEWPQQLLQARLRSVNSQDYALSNHVTLLWDDPTRIPRKYHPNARLREPQSGK